MCGEHLAKLLKHSKDSNILWMPLSILSQLCLSSKLLVARGKNKDVQTVKQGNTYTRLRSENT